MARRATWFLLLPMAALLQAMFPACNCNNNAARLLMVEELRTASADKDVLGHVPKSQRYMWEYHDGRSINETLQSFSDIPVDIVIALKLVGFNGDGINHVNVQPTELVRYLRGLHLDLQTAVLEPELRVLSIRPRLHFVASKVSTSLTQKLAGTITTAAFEAKQASSTPYLTVYVPHTEVDKVLTEEERALAGGPGGQAGGGHRGGSTPPPTLTLYLLNLEPNSDTDYLYTYYERPEVVAAGNWSEFKSCPGALFASSQRTNGAGVAWVDLAAAPHSYGPLRGGQGQVFPHSLPHATAFQPTVVNLALLPELAALAASAVQHLAWPPLQHARLALPRPHGGDSLTVQVVHIHDTLAIPPQSVKLGVLQAELSSALQGTSVRVEVRESYLSFAMCDLCVNAYTNALRVRTQRQEGSNVVAAAGQILDRLVLHQTMAQYADVIMAYAGVHDTHDVLPVFVFDLSMRDEALLLDGALQAAAFPDLVLAVATRASSVHARFSCGHMTRSLEPSDVTRAVLGAVLQSGFGTAHTALRYHPASGAGWNYLWALGSTPFGPLSSLTSLSAATANTVSRNLAAVELDRQAGRIAAVLQGLSRLSPKGHWPTAVPRKEQRNRLFARLNVAALKMELAVAAMSQGRNGDALRLARLMSHDAAAVERLAVKLDKALEAKMECRGGTDWTVLLWPPAGSLLALALAAWWRSRGARLRADARYDKIY